MKLFREFSAVIIITVIMTFAVSSGNIHAKNKQVLTEKFLFEGNWKQDEISDCGILIMFQTDGSFTMYRDDFCNNEATEDALNAEGSYKIKGNKIILKVEVVTNGRGISEGETFTGILKETDSLIYKWYLEFNQPLGTVTDIDSRRQEGEPFVLDGIETVAMGAKEGLTTAVVKVRTKPGTSSPEMNYSCCSTCGTSKTLKKGHNVIIYARTKNRDKAGNKENYWYFIEFTPGNCGDYEEYFNGWVFAEFIKIK